MRETLTQKQEKFCLNYVKLGNISEAAIEAGYKPTSAYVCGSDNLKKPLVAQRIAELRQKAEDKTIMSIQERKQRLTEIASAKLTDFMELGADGSWVNIGKETKKGGAISEIHSRTEYDENGSHPTVHTSVKLYDPTRAIDLLNKMEGIYEVSQPPSVTVNVNQKVENNVIRYDANDIAGAIIEAEKLGISTEILKSPVQNTPVLSSQSNPKTNTIPEHTD